MRSGECDVTQSECRHRRGWYQIHQRRRYQGLTWWRTNGFWVWALTGHVTEEMQRHYSTVGLDEKWAAIAGVLRLMPPDPRRGDRAGGTGGDHQPYFQVNLAT